MINSLSYKEWDSQFFGRPIFDLNTKVLDSLSLADFIDVEQALIQAKISASNMSLLDQLQSLNFLFAESEMVFEKSLYSIENTEIKAWPAEFADLETVMQLAAKAFRFSRFRTPWFDQNASSDFYAEWAKNAILEKHDDLCLKIEDSSNKSLLGFVTGKLIDTETARIGLIGITELMRGQKLGASLLAAIENWALNQGATKILVSTQGSNVQACSFYLKNNYQVKEINYWLYKG